MMPVLVSAITGTHIVFILAIAALAVAAPYLTRLARQKTGSPPEAPPRDPDEWPSHQRIRRTADKALVELVETGREISAQIDTRIRILNKLVREADEAASRLERLQGSRSGESLPEQAESTPARNGDTDARKAVSPPETADAPTAEPAGTVPEGGAGPESAQGPTAGGRSVSRSALHDRVAALAAEGRSAEDIARDLRLSTSEVCLALHLLRQGAGGESVVYPSDAGQLRDSVGAREVRKEES